MSSPSVLATTLGLDHHQFTQLVWFNLSPQPDPGLVSSMLPPFAIELVERACDYVTRIPKPRAVKSGRISLELATMGLLHGALCIAGSQTDKDG